ncbi:MAG TPA: hypothetical protein VN788_08240 [Verrucomicrobiae bacterium]|nr:hypothetical protein [Verrucomicrobiae bacterium]
MPETYTSKTQLSSHTEGTKRGEERLQSGGLEAGREGDVPTARSSTSINPKTHDPIDPRMPHIHPA